jgi:hypothetical protein
MVTKKKITENKEEKRGRAKIRTLTVNKESVKDLTASQRKQIHGGKAKAIISLVCETGAR